jgi:hypothetical protein
MDMDTVRMALIEAEETGHYQEAVRMLLRAFGDLPQPEQRTARCIIAMSPQDL